MVRALILAGLQEHCGALGSTLNSDFNDIAGSHAHALFLTAWQDETVVGTGALILEAAGICRIVRTSFDQRYGRKGTGRRILNEVIAHARAQGNRLVVLETIDTWSDAIAFLPALQLPNHRS
ncbi:MAG: GNAT family N-acetyltransferase [Anaerolineae bacterium]|nr:GNAT family N-acetyltransferase [Thermoflexales bacterium]MDW8408049.1 GNAT family N-acetyltransferase [Anaerolineae bacterium]